MGGRRQVGAQSSELGVEMIECDREADPVVEVRRWRVGSIVDRRQPVEDGPVDLI
jgi:hypothetical protein